MQQIALPVFFVVLSVILRLLPHAWNVAPVIGVGLFCGAYLPRRWALVVPVLAMAAGDLLLGWIPEHLFGWVAVLLSAFIGFALRHKRTPLRVAGASFFGSTIFFLLSNFGVWAVGCGRGFYPPTWEGLAACYAAGIPFYRNGIAGDLLYAGILFGSYEFLFRWSSRASTVEIAVSKQP